MFNIPTSNLASMLKVGVLRLLVVTMLLQGWVMAAQASVMCPHSLPKSVLGGEAKGLRDQSDVANEKSPMRMPCHKSQNSLESAPKQLSKLNSMDASSPISQQAVSQQAVSQQDSGAKVGGHDCCQGSGLCSHCLFHASAVLQEENISIGVTTLSLLMDTPFQTSPYHIDRASIDRPPIII